MWFSKILSFVLLLGMCLLASCSPAASLVPATPQSSKHTPSQSPTTNRIPTATEEIPLETSQPSQTPTSTLTSEPIDTATPTPLACWQDGGQIVLDQIETDLLRQPLDYRVYLPPCYAEQPQRHYPVLYLIHGQSFNDDQWDRLGVDETADRLIASGQLSPFLVVMPRDREWTQPDVDPFGQVVIEMLIPTIDRDYRTLNDRLFRAVGGLSRGASWAIHFGLKEWQRFGAFGGHSPPVFWGDVAHVKRWLDEIPTEAMPRIWLDIGEDDRPEILESAVWFEKLLTLRNIPHEWHMFSGYHEELYWEAHVEQYLRWYARDW